MAIIQKLIDYLKSSRAELKYVNWPSKKTTIKFTYLVIFVSVLVAVFLGLLDVSFRYILDKFII